MWTFTDAYRCYVHVLGRKFRVKYKERLRVTHAALADKLESCNHHLRRFGGTADADDMKSATELRNVIARLHSVIEERDAAIKVYESKTHLRRTAQEHVSQTKLAPAPQTPSRTHEHMVIAKPIHCTTQTLQHLLTSVVQHATNCDDCRSMKLEPFGPEAKTGEAQLYIQCTCGFRDTWASLPLFDDAQALKMKTRSIYDVLTVFAVVCSGLNYSAFKQACLMRGHDVVESSAFYRILRTVIGPAIARVWRSDRSDVIEYCRNQDVVAMLTDGR